MFKDDAKIQLLTGTKGSSHDQSGLLYCLLNMTSCIPDVRTLSYGAQFEVPFSTLISVLGWPNRYDVR